MVKVLLKLALLCSVAFGVVHGVQLYFRQLEPLDRARWHIQLREYDKAIPLLYRALQLEPENRQLYLLLGDAYEMRHDRATAMTYYRAAEDLLNAPGNEYYRNRFTRLRELGF